MLKYVAKYFAPKKNFRELRKKSRGLMLEPWRPWQLKNLTTAHGPLERLPHINR